MSKLGETDVGLVEGTVIQVLVYAAFMQWLSKFNGCAHGMIAVYTKPPRSNFGAVRNVSLPPLPYPPLNVDDVSMNL